MRNLIKRQPLGAASMIVALVAVSVALVGTSVAGSGNKVTANQLAKNAVKTGKIRNGAVTEPKLGTGAVTQSKLGAIERVQKTLPVGAGPASAADTVACPSGTKVISGGAAYVVTNGNQDIQIRSSFRDGNGWRVAVHNSGAGAQNYLIEAYCLVD